MKNVAVINTCDFGSTGKIAKGLFEHLKEKGYKCLFVYGRGEKAHDANIIKMEGQFSIYFHYAITKMVGADGYGSTMVTKQLIRKLRDFEIDTVYIVSLHGHYLNENVFFDYLTADKIKVVYIMIDEYAYLGSCSYSNECERYKQQCRNCPRQKSNLISKIIDTPHKRYLSKKKYYNTLDNPVFVGPEYTIIRSGETGLLEGLHTSILDEAINTELFKPKETSQFKESLGINEEKTVIVCVAPYSYERKGVKYFYLAAKELINVDRFVFVHVGYDGNEQTFASNMIVKGYEKDQDMLSMYYSMADLFVFPSLLDTMPNACLEALSSGTPLLCFDISGMPYIANNEVASFVEPQNVKMMVDVILQTKKKDKAIIEKCRNYALKRYDRNKYFETLERLGE